MEKLSYKIDAFEGPLDLLLRLIAKNKLDILDIPIAALLEQYLKQMDVMRDNEMEIESEFLEMAARLVYIKTVSLLPRHEEAEELKRELTGQLLEYQECKRVAALLAGQFQFNSFTRMPAPFTPDMRYKRRHDPRELLEAYQNVLGKGKRQAPPTPQAFSGIVAHHIVSVASQIVYVLRLLWKRGEVAYDALFEEKKERSELVATFLAVLELVKGKRVRVEGESTDITVKLMEGGVKRWRSKSSGEK